jgi:glyoxylase-like metal-dependent hydrolase (beta-lactamase superfamily II)
MSNTIGDSPIYWVSAFHVDDLLVDTGCDYTKKEIANVLKEKKLTKVVNTHHHEDHVGGDHLLQSTCNVPIFAHPLAIPLLRVSPDLPSFEVFAWGIPEPSEPSPVPDVIETENHEFLVVYVPGHTSDHIALVERSEGWVFVGDLYVTTKPVAASLQENQWQAISSLKKIREFSPRVMFPGVNDPIFDASSVLDRSISIREELGRRILKLNEQGSSVTQIVNEVFGREAEFNRMGIRGTYKNYTDGQFSTENLTRTFLLKADQEPLRST